MRTVKQVSEASGVSVRALHHYDHIGLLTPRTGANGYRYYGDEELLRLQQILFYRELGMPLAEIARILDDPELDVRTTLADLKRRLEQDIARRGELIRTIERTLELVNAGRPVGDSSLFTGISAEKQAAWEAELVERFGTDVQPLLAESRRRIDALTAAELSDFKAEIDSIHADIVELIEAGGTPSSAAAQSLVARHFKWVSRSWRPDAVTYPGLGRMYLEHGDFRAHYDALHPHLAEFLVRAMVVYARDSLQQEEA